jgi:hypothetical protein
LTLAVIKAKFTEEMNAKKERAGPPKKKKLDDAPLSSEDEDQKAFEVKEKIVEIKKSKNRSPRTKDNDINKIKIQNLIWRANVAIQKKDVEHKIVER